MSGNCGCRLTKLLEILQLTFKVLLRENSHYTEGEERLSGRLKCGSLPGINGENTESWGSLVDREGGSYAATL